MSATHIPAALRRLVRERAREYCLIPEAVTFAAHAIDHIVADKHGGPTTAENLALSCAICNGHKASTTRLMPTASTIASTNRSMPICSATNLTPSNCMGGNRSIFTTFWTFWVMGSIFPGAREQPAGRA
jgi:HNH endonuclease